MPSRVRVAGLIGGRAYFGRQILNYLYNVADSAGVMVSKRRRGETWRDILAAWEVVDKYIDGCKLYVVRERRGVHPSRSLFNQKLLGYRRNRKKKVEKRPGWVAQAALADGNAFWNGGQVGEVVVNDAPEQPRVADGIVADFPPPARRVQRLIGQNAAGELVYENR